MSVGTYVMPGESELHVGLVRKLTEVISTEHANLYGLVIYSDRPTNGRDRPPPITGFIPDVFAVDAPETIRIIGEAKTPSDLETDRSARQIMAFLAHLARAPNAQFYLCVPWSYRARAATLLESWAIAAVAQRVPCQVVA